jgi:biotin carboxyl carrier protein
VKYYVRVGAKTCEVELEGGRVVVDGRAVEAHLAPVPGTPLHHLLLGGLSWTIAAQALEGLGADGGTPLILGAVGERFEVEAVDERTRQIRALTGARRPVAGGGTVTAPMPGLVVRVEVEPGQRVEAGVGLVVVEAMKMENELRAPRPAVVAAVHVAPGQAVEKGAPLVTLESVEPSS